MAYEARHPSAGDAERIATVKGQSKRVKICKTFAPVLTGLGPQLMLNRCGFGCSSALGSYQTHAIGRSPWHIFPASG